jgi:acetyltransferase
MAGHPFDLLFKPGSVAIFGASAKENSIGRALLANLRQADFPGPIYPINPKYSEILDVPAYPSVLAVQQPIDLAIIAIPIKDVPAIFQECGQAGVKAAIIISSGGKEVGPAGEKIEAAIEEEAAQQGIRYLGPNSWGALCPLANFHGTFASRFARLGSLAFISQSGALSSSIIGWASQKNFGFSHFLSLGSGTNIDFADLIDYLGNDDKARSIIIYMESLSNHRKFMSAARQVSRIKPIIVIKAGRSQAGAQAAASHTGVLAGEDAAYNAAFRRAGIIRVDTIGQLFDCAEALGKVQRPVRGSLGIITNAGGAGVMAVDALSRWKIPPPTLSPETLQKLNEFLPANWSRGNPLDILGDASPERYDRAVRLCLEAPEFAGLVVILSPLALTDPTGVARVVAAAAAAQAKPVFAVWMGGAEVLEGINLLNDASIPTFETPEAAVDTFMEMYLYSRNLELLQETPPRLPSELKVNTKQARSFIDQCLEPRPRTLTEIESKAILSAYGIPVNPTMAASSGPEAVRAAQAIGYPVVLKINSPDITHKSDVQGGVLFYLRNDQEVLAAFEQIMTATRNHYPDARILGVTVQSQEGEADCEILLGSKRDADFGPLILFGLGGTFTEVMEDYAIDLPPLNLHLARRLMERTRVYRLLQGYRQVPPANLDLLGEILVRLSQLVTDFPEILELDINPLLVVHGRMVAVDARMVIEPSQVPAPRHLAISPYPNQYESDWLMRDGTPVLLRPMKPEDEPLVADFLHKCSDDTIYFRYFRLIKNWTHEMLIRFTQNDYDRELGLMAIGQPPSPEVMMGVSRLVIDRQQRTAEFAVIVADPWQGKGLGPKLLEQVIAIARDQEVKLLWGEVLSANQPMLDLAKKIGFALKRAAAGVVKIEMAL